MEIGEREMQDQRLSQTMLEALAEIEAHGGIAERWPGGFWTYPDCPRDTRGYPSWSVGATTIKALTVRGKLAFTEWKEGRNYRFPIRAAVAAAESAS